MTYKIDYSKNSLRDIKAIYEYIAFKLLSPIAANNQMNRILKAISALNTMPFRFKSFKEEPWKSKGLRIFTVDNYNIIYLPNKKTKIVTIARIVYGGRDLQNILQE